MPEFRGSNKDEHVQHGACARSDVPLGCYSHKDHYDDGTVGQF